MYNSTDTGVLSTPDDRVIIDKVQQHIDKSHYSYTRASAWTKGWLKGEEQSYAYLYRQLERLYDIPIIYPNNDSAKGIYDIPYRYLTPANVLEWLGSANHSDRFCRGDSIYIVAQKNKKTAN